MMLSIACSSQAGCATLGDANKAPHAVLENLAVGKAQDLIVEFDDSAILAQALQLNKDRGILFDDNETLRFKTERYSAMKAAIMATLPSGKVEVIKNYDALPLMFLRFRSAEALKVLLAHPAVVRVYEDKKKSLMLREVSP